MASGFKDINGTDLDDLFELAPSLEYSIAKGEVRTPVGTQGDRITNIPSNQFQTNNGEIDLMERYMHAKWGSVASSTAFGFTYIAEARYDDNGKTMGPVYEYWRNLYRYAAAKGSGGTVPSWSTSSSSSAGGKIYITSDPSDQSYHNRTSSKTGTPNGFAISSYSIVAQSGITRTSGEYNIDLNKGNTWVVNSSGKVTCHIWASSSSAGTAYFSWWVDVKCYNAMGASVSHRHHFTQSVEAAGSSGCLDATHEILTSTVAVEAGTLAIGNEIPSTLPNDLPDEQDDPNWFNWRTEQLTLTPTTSVVVHARNITLSAYASINNGLIRCSRDHRMLTNRNGIYAFIQAQSLMSGDLLQTSGADLLVTSSEIINSELIVTKLDVEDVDTYYGVKVGDDYIIHHNFKA